ncbi:hypothetical protein JHK85_010078 [Glycine max]|nr:hypothetical protein JHK85_010078 [Glycine max]
MREMPDEKLRLCFVFPLHVLFFDFFHSMFIVSSKATFFFPTIVQRRWLDVLFFSIFFTACSLFLLKLSFLSQKTSIFISKLHECASFSLSMCFFFDFFHNMFIVSSKAIIFISKSFNFSFQTP